jgi:hypothetical protein
MPKPFDVGKYASRIDVEYPVGLQGFELLLDRPDRLWGMTMQDPLPAQFFEIDIRPPRP